MKVEITHDILARKIYDRIGAEDKMRLKIKEFIYDRYTYFQEANVLLTSKDLNYITPYLGKISVGPEQEVFIKKSQQEAKKRENRRRATVLTVITILTLISIWSFLNWQKATQANERAVNFLLKETEKNIYELEHETAWEKLQVADSLGLNNQAEVETVFRQIMEIAFFQNEVGDLQNAREKALFAADLKRMDSYLVQQAEDQDNFRDALQKLDQDWVDSLKRRTGVFPSRMVPLEKGTVWDSTWHIQAGQQGTGQNDAWHKLDAFEIAPTEVSVWQYAIYCMESKECAIDTTAPGWGLQQDNPVVNVSWYDAARFANWMSLKHNKEPVYIFEDMDRGIPGQVSNKIIDIRPDIPGAFRLPTSAEWAYAAKYGEGDTSIFFPRHTLPFIEQVRFTKGILSSHGWYDSDTISRAMPIGLKQPTKAGIYDMGGNVWEWCEDDVKGIEIRQTYRLAPCAVEDFSPNTSNAKIIRGGSFSYIDQITRTGHWQAFFPFFRVDAVGFRLVRNKD